MTGTSDRHKPIKITKKKMKKNMKAGNKIYFNIFFRNLFTLSFIICRRKISTTPLINLNKIKPSFEEIEKGNENLSNKTNIKIKKKIKYKNPSCSINWIR